APPIPLDTLHVEYDRATFTFPVSTRGVVVLTAQDLAQAPVRNVAELLGWALGLDLTTGAGSSSRSALRGGTSQQIVILVDGMRVNDNPSGPHAPEVDLPLDEVARIEILRGPSSAALGGDGASGVVQIVTRRESTAGLSAHLEGGSFQTVNAGVSGRIG